MEDKIQGLCYRCEHRATFKETGYAPRSECKSEISVMGCYCYKPVKPLVIKPRKGDKRPISLDILSCRIEAVKIADVELTGKKIRGGYIVYWQPKEKVIK
jgi:hypothetical protein